MLFNYNSIRRIFLLSMKCNTERTWGLLVQSLMIRLMVGSILLVFMVQTL